MYLVIFVCLVAVINTFLESNGNFSGGMKLGFFFVTLLGVIHYNYGMDYMSYYYTFKELNAYQYSFHDMLYGNVYRQNQFGWVLLNRFFGLWGKYGFFWMVAFLNILQNIIYYRFIKNYVPRNWWTLGMFIYLFSTHFYLINFSMMRQGLSIALFLWAYMLADRKKYIWAVFVVLIGASVHTSCLVVIPFVFWKVIPFNKGKRWAIIYIVLFVVLFLSRDLLNNIYSTFFGYEDFEEYNRYRKASNTFHIGIGFMINLIPFLMSLWFIARERFDNIERKMTALACVGTMVIPFTQVISLANRIGLYFIVLNIATIPYVYRQLTPKILRIGLLVIYIGMLLLDYYRFFTDPVFIRSYLHFHTIFDVL